MCSSVTTGADCFVPPPPPVTSLPRTPGVDSFAAPLAPGEFSCARVQRFPTNRFVNVIYNCLLVVLFSNILQMLVICSRDECYSTDIWQSQLGVAFCRLIRSSFRVMICSLGICTSVHIF